MGLLDKLIGTVPGGGSGSTDLEVHHGLIEQVLGMAGNPQTGGLGGLLDQLKAGGLSSAVNSWVGNGPNEAVSGDQIRSALGADQIRQMAQKFGLTPSQVSSHLSQILPELVDHLTPNGSVPETGIVASAIAMLKGKLLPR